MHVLSPDGVFPYEIWQKAYSDFWKSPAIECARLYKVDNPPFPETDQLPEKFFPTDIYAKWIVDFFFEMARRIPVRALEAGFNYIVVSTYDDKSAVSDADREYLFYHLTLIEKSIANAARTKGIKDINIKLSSPDVLLKIFPDTIAVDKKAAVHYLSVVQKYPFDHEVKGITHSLVDSIINSSAEDKPAFFPQESPAGVQSPMEENGIRVPAALWEGKPPATVRDAMKDEYGKAVIAYVLRNWLKTNKTETGRLLSDKQYDDEKSYRNFVDDLMEEAAHLTIIKA